MLNYIIIPIMFTVIYYNLTDFSKINNKFLTASIVLTFQIIFI